MSPDADMPTPPPGGPPPPPAQVPPPPQWVESAPIYRQDVLVRAPGPWTRSLQMAIAAYFALNALVSLAITFAIIPEIRRRIEDQIRSQGTVAADQVSTAVNIGVSIGVAFVVIFSVLGLLIALGSYLRRWTWLYVVDMVLLGFAGVLGTLFAVIGIAAGGSSLNPPIQQYTGLIFDIIALALFIWSTVAVARFGPWGQPKVPSQLES